MVDYSDLDEQLLDGIRSLPGYQDFSKFLRKYWSLSNIINVKPILQEYRMLFDDDSRYHFESLVIKYGEWAFIQGCKAVHNAYMRTTRVRQRIQYIRDHFGDLYFVTFTIDDEYIDTFTNDIKLGMSLVKNTLNQCSSVWVFNSDYGDKRGRLHWHACCPCNLCCFSDLQCLWPYGIVNVKRVGNDECDERKIARYQTKLARHAVKQSAFKVCYSRLKKKKV